MRIAVIGGGAAGLAVVRALLAQATRRLTVDWHGVPRRFTGGPAYDTDQPWHRLNVPVARMGLPADAADDFQAWCARNGRLDPADPFRPRGAYRDYLNDHRRRLLALARRNGHPLHSHAAPVDSIAPHAGGWLIAAGGRDVPCDAIVLATGNPTLLPRPAGRWPEINALPGRAAEAVLCRRLPRLDVTRPIVILGTGLSMLDHTMSLAAHGWQGPIIGLSRSAALPEVHGSGPEWAGDHSPLTHGRLSQRLRRFRALIRAHGGHWRPVFDALRPHTVALWQTLEPRDQARFFRRLWSHWNRFRHRAAPSVMSRIDLLRDRGQLSIIKGSATPETIAALKPALVINALGPSFQDLRRHPLLEPNAARLAPLAPGLPGLPLDSCGRVLGDWPAPLFALGCLGLGCRLESVAMPEIRQQAAAVARAVLSA